MILTYYSIIMYSLISVNNKSDPSVDKTLLLLKYLIIITFKTIVIK